MRSAIRFTINLKLAGGLIAILMICAFSRSLFAQDNPAKKEPIKKLILDGESFLINDRPAFILWPPKEKRQTPQPWIMYAPTLPGLPDVHEKWMHEKFISAGVAVAGIDIGEAYGNPAGQDHFSALYHELTENRGFTSKPCLLGRSRGGLWVSSWAINNPDKVAGIAGIYPVFDLTTYPGLKKAAPAYGLTTKELESALEQHNPISGIDRLAESRVPVFIIHGDVDKVVPLQQNSAALMQRYEQARAGDVAQLVVVKGQGHNLWEGFFHCQELVDFAIERAQAETHDWPSFRGPTGDGISVASGFPNTWGVEENIKWKIPLPAPSNGSPIVSNGRVFLTMAEDGGKKRSLYCFDRKDGKQLWVRSVEIDESMPTHKTNPHGSSTPAANGRVVLAWHSSAGLHCYDFAGNQLWSRDLGEFRHMWGSGSSPVIYQDRVILNCGPGKRVFLTALDLKNGKTLWEQVEPQDSQETDRRADGHYKGSWATPVIARVGDQMQIVCSMPTRVCGYDPVNGKVLWSCDGLRGPKGDLAYSSPMVSKNFCVAFSGFQGPSIGFQLGEQGDITDSSRQWRNPKNPQNIGTGIFEGGYVYRVNASAGPLVECQDAETGKTIWRGPRGGAGWASLVKADGLLYATNQDATTYVFRLNPKKYDEVAQNKLDEVCNATPAMSDGEIFIRTHKNLYCIGQ